MNQPGAGPVSKAVWALEGVWGSRPPSSASVYRDMPRVRSLEPRKCPTCGNSVPKENRRFCSNSCVTLPGAEHRNLRYEDYIAQWKRGKVSGLRGGTSLSMHIRRYLFEQRGPQCWVCNWSQVNPVTGRVPLHVDHIDGCWGHNHESNLRLLCPNCHSLTPTYGVLNKGRGRPDRRVIGERTYQG